VQIFIVLNLSFRIIKNKHFRQLLQMLRPNLTFVHRTKLLFMIFLKYDNICIKIKQDLKKLQRIFIALLSSSLYFDDLYLFFIIFALSLIFSYLTLILLLFISIKFFNSLLIELRELNILRFATFLSLKNVFTNLLNSLITFKF